MSDERDDADVAADEPRGGRTAVVTPQRPTGKRSRQRSGDDAEGSSGAVELTESTADEKAGKKPKKAKDKGKK